MLIKIGTSPWNDTDAVNVYADPTAVYGAYPVVYDPNGQNIKYTQVVSKWSHGGWAVRESPEEVAAIVNNAIGDES